MPIPIQRILAPTDFSEPARRGLDYALWLGKSLGAKVHVLHVCPLLQYAIAPDAAISSPDFVEKVQEELKKKLAELAGELKSSGVEITTELILGSPYAAIAETANHGSFDLVVLATHGRTGLAHLTLGSVAERTVRTSEVPVITVPAGE